MDFAEVAPKFALYHQSKGSVNVHIGTTVLGLVGFACLVTRALSILAWGRAMSGCVWFVYAVLLCVSVPNALESVCVVCFVALLSAKLDLGWFPSVAAIASAYALQDAAHWYYGEETYQQNSWGASGVSFNVVIDLFIEHCLYLLPLTLSCATPAARAVACLLPVALVSWANYVLDSDSKWGLPFLSTKSRLLVGKFESPSDLADLAACRKWCVARGPSRETTSHWWVADLDTATGAAFDRLVHSDAVHSLFKTKFREGYAIEPVHGMNELYVSAAERKGPKNSDDVFFTEHVDGPFCFFPFASVYRCIVALDENKPGFSTHFRNAHKSLTARTGDILAFDFHRESHYITKQAAELPDDDSRYRIVLKLHYVAAPESVFWCGRLLRWLSVKYNQLFRALFLATIQPTSAFSKIVADIGVVGSTILYNAVEKYVGYANLVYYVTVASLAYATSSYDVFLYATQFLHYFRYIYTYYDRDNVAFGQFKRDALIYKTVALVQLLGIVAAPALGLAPCPVESCAVRLQSLALIALGYGVSIAATNALGIDGTYFGIELGHVKDKEYKFVTRFPYNCIPHPMILGQVVALLGVHLDLKQRYPLLAPIHIALYLTHMTQEAYDFHAGTPWYLISKDKQA